MLRRAVDLETYRRLTLLLSLTGAVLFASGLVVLVQTQLALPTAVLMVLGALAALGTSGLEIRGALPAKLPSLALYTRPECALCDEARARLEALRPELAFDVWEVDVSRDAALEARYGTLVPVVERDGREVFRVQFDEGRVRQALAG